ncbi:MAG: hypothetical protein Tsb0021_15500 [Chlamydiales bacterium]
MRLLAEIQDPQKALRFSRFLESYEISHQCEPISNLDWGSEEYGDQFYRLWITDEDQFEEAVHWWSLFQINPEDPRFDTSGKASKPLFSLTKEEVQKQPPPFNSLRAKLKPQKKSIGPVTLYLLILCTLLFIWTKTTAPDFRPYPNYLPPMALFSSNTTKVLLYDFPRAYTLANELMQRYGLEELKTPPNLPPEGRQLLNEFLSTPYWQGFYKKIIAKLKNPQEEIRIEAPLFEKISEGEAWRLITPCILHFDIIHLFFNMAWLLVLGQQMEPRLGIFRFISFLIIVGVISNTAQYLMSGANFIGFSGILCGMIVFIWIRQSRAPWEGYFLHRSTMGMITLFVLIMAGIQIAAFIAELYMDQFFSPGIANTAHLSGALMGYILAISPFFRWKPSIS